jgi:hypothetical protein
MKEIKDVLKAVLDSYENGGNLLIMDWPVLVGEELSKHSRFIETTKRCMTVEVSHSGWKQVFMMHKKEILDRINKFYPDYEIMNVILTVKNEDKTSIKGSGVSLDRSKKEDRPNLEDAINNVSNEEFREYLKNLNKRIEGL